MTSSKTWHIASWHPLAWVETVIKLAAFAVAIPAGARALGAGGLALPGGETLAQFVILAVLALGLLAAIYDRWLEKEIIAMGFVVLNNLAHWGMVLALAAPINAPLVAFAGLMLLGDLVKLVFLRTADFAVRDTPQRVLYSLTLFYVVGYLLLLLIALL
ncbi:MAG: hypothetical protein JXN59_10140 [Anaerolineae bacterium]|nr:hypothetical protein [Anaerolineae bacterium]